ncbi:hypothetical protein GWK47_053653 [Chionoecetes opilio]|uniref:Uncharacterized protein n=1 Tax=Chionoecetes opilio TaxID=41210 RepID=A0A8J5CPG1_CHIOP|nr:hypothetical protein GWK47_053653 [Chionoecetes opilio]
MIIYILLRKGCKLLNRFSRMPINTVELLSLVTQLCEEKNLRVPIKESLKGGLLTFATTALGGLLAGPVGLAIAMFLRVLVAHGFLEANGLGNMPGATFTGSGLP